MTRPASPAIAILFTMLAACGAGSPPATVSNTAPAGTSASPPPAVQPAAANALPLVPCSQEVSFWCDGVDSDGCMTGVTTFHACTDVYRKPGPSCSQEIALECSSQEGITRIDGCLHDPP